MAPIFMNNYIQDRKAFEQIKTASQNAIELIGHPERDEDENLNKQLIEIIESIECQIEILKSIEFLTKRNYYPETKQ